jgi:hypothetical protein
VLEDKLDEWARKLKEAFDRSASIRSNEQELREDVHGLVLQAASELYGLSDIGTAAEHHAGGDGHRPLDRMYGGLVVEWEWRMGRPRREHGAQQALDYLARVRASNGEDAAFTAVVCDGKLWGFLVAEPPQQQLAIGDPPARRADENFEWRENSEAACRRFLALIGSHRKRPVTAGAMAAAFGPGSEVTRRAITLLTEAIVSRSDADRTDTLFNEWHRSLEVVYDNFGDSDGKLARALRDAYHLTTPASLGELLFAVHTYFALVARLIAIEVLALSAHDQPSRPTLWVTHKDDDLILRLREIDAGSLPESLRVQNLFEGDLFSWYLGALAGNLELLAAIRGVLSTTDEFAFPRLAYGANPARDVLRDLYHDLLPRDLRKALGEFLTPPWLAQACLERLDAVGANVRSGRVLDPTCGTGTFLMPVLNSRLSRLRADSDNTPDASAIQAVLDSVVGFDLNPVAVIAARVNYVVALGDLAAAGDLTIPVWRADAVLVPDTPTRQTTIHEGRLNGRPWQELRTSLDEPFPIPPSLSDAQRIPVLRRLLEEALEEPNTTRGEGNFVAALDEWFGIGGTTEAATNADEWDDLREVAVELYHRIKKLADEDRNGVWARVIENSFAPIFAGTFDVVVGNPPWLAWNKLPASWRAGGEIYWKRYGLWRPPASPGSSRRANAQVSDIATLVYATAVARYAKTGGFVGFLCPKSLAIGDPGGRAFRRFNLRTDTEDIGAVGEGPHVQFAPRHLDDWSAISPFAPDAGNKPIFLITEVGASPSYPVATSQWERGTPGARLGGEWHVLRAALRERLGSSGPVTAEVPTSAWSFTEIGTSSLAGGANTIPFGKGIDTRGANGIFFVNITSQRPDASNRINIVNDPANGRNKDIPSRRGAVEADLVYPLLRGKDVTRWHATPRGHIILPYRQDEMGYVIRENGFKASYRYANRWLSSFRPFLEARKIVATLHWDLSGDDYCQVMGPLQFLDGRPVVVMREIASRPAAAVVTQRYDGRLGRTATVIVDHKLVFCGLDSEDHAHYVAGMLNCAPMQALLRSFASSVGLAPVTLQRLPIPAFDPVAHASLVQAAIDAASAAAAADAAGLATADAAVDAAAANILA